MFERSRIEQRIALATRERLRVGEPERRDLQTSRQLSGG